jgi:hypothetical protein
MLSLLLLPRLLSSQFSIAFCDAAHNDEHNAKTTDYSSSAAYQQPNGVRKWNDNWDLKQSNDAKGIRQIVLIRHGQYVQAKSGDADRKLTDLGKS